jgi:hypothetical protein
MRRGLHYGEQPNEWDHAVHCHESHRCPAGSYIGLFGSAQPTLPTLGRLRMLHAVLLKFITRKPSNRNRIEWKTPSAYVFHARCSRSYFIQFYQSQDNMSTFRARHRGNLGRVHGGGSYHVSLFHNGAPLVTTLSPPVHADLSSNFHDLVR